ncbi:hypothetical protein JCM10908_000682 [Rhodotorula pacifica]|uniref:uncharacterized protein n=1 Tax=Rhodotorula pacifica TaxID=1495444 RepID=UPI003176D0A1
MAAPLAGPSGVNNGFGQGVGAVGDTRLYDALRRWSAAVRVEGIEAEVFKVEHQLDKTTCYIIAEEGKEFEIMVRREEQPTMDESTVLSIDGMVMTSHTHHHNTHKMEDTFKGKRVSATEIRPFMFAPIALTDPDEAIQDESIIQGLGSIRLNFHRVVREGVVKKKRHDFADTPAQQRIDENCKKATMSHSTTFGAPRTAPLPSGGGKPRPRYKYIDSRDDPLYSMVFQYRSRALLEAEGIVEALPEPVAAREPAHPARARASADSASASPPPSPPVKLPSSAERPPIKKRKSETITLSDSDSDAEEGDTSRPRGKIARLEAELAVLRGEVKPESGSSPAKVKREATLKQENVKVVEKDGRVTLELLDD